MRKIPPEHFEDLHFIRLSSLPYLQMVRLRDWLGEAAIISISHPNGIIRNCVKYEGYEFWFDMANCESLYEESSLF